MVSMFAKLNLHIQMLTSYLLVLGISLGITAAALMLFLGNQPAPKQPTYQRLAALVQGLNLIDIMQDFGSNRSGMNMLRVTSLLDDYAMTRSVRVMLMYAEDNRQYVLYDSLKTYDDSEAITIYSDNFVSTRLQAVISPFSHQVSGSFTDPDGVEWLFFGLARSTPRLRQSDGTSFLLLAEPRPLVSLQEVLIDFSSALLPPLLQAGLVGSLVSLLLAALISRGIARPLQALAAAASAVARGDFDQRVKETGPVEIRAVARAFNQMSAEVRATQQAQRDFLANVSHDLKTPLTSIQGYSQAIVDGAAKDPAEAARIIYDESGRLNRMVIELTDLIRMQSGRLSMQLTMLDVGSIAAAIGQRLQVVATNKQVDLRIQTGPLPSIVGDGDRLAQVLTNLLSNAIKYTPPGGHVVLETHQNNDGVEIVVRDSGIGIPPDDLPRLFERFYQVDKTRGPKRGLGLGLAISKEIVNAHGGEISITSPGEGQGTTATVWLPLPDTSTVVNRRV